LQVSNAYEFLTPHLQQCAGIYIGETTIHSYRALITSCLWKWFYRALSHVHIPLHSSCKVQFRLLPEPQGNMQPKRSRLAATTLKIYLKYNPAGQACRTSDTGSAYCI